MRRRDLLGAAAGWWVASSCAVGASGEGPQAVNREVDRDGRWFLKPPQELLFTDLRHVDAGDLVWRASDGKAIPVAGPPEPPVPVVADPARVARGVRFVAQKANKEGPVEGQPTSVIYADGLYRAWRIRTDYPAGRNLGSYSLAPARSITVEYSESKDGYAWQRRDLDEIPVSNLTGIDGDGFFVDPQGPAEERYKGILNARVLADVAALWQQYQKVHPRNRHVSQGPDYIYCLFGLTSPDGIQWKLLPKPLLIHKGDTDNTVYYDPWLGKYVLYTRLMRYDRRIIARCESDDFRRWTPVEPMVTASLQDPCSYDVYTNARTSYPGLPEQHLMLPLVYRRETQRSEIHLYTSADGILWDRVPGGPVLAPSDPPGWDGKFVVAGKNLVPLGQDRVAIPYWGASHPHKYPRWPGVITSKTGWAWWPKGRLVGLAADQEGEFHTLGIPVSGGQLRINAKVRSGGQIRVGIHGPAGRSAADSDPITGDHLAHPVTWRGDAKCGVTLGSTVRLHLQLRAAELFGLQWS
jgi:hypothetical protein